MKSKIVILSTTLLLSLSTFAQKDELKVCKKIYEKATPSETDAADFKANIMTIEKMVTGSTPTEIAYTAFYKSAFSYVDYLAAMSKSADKANPAIVSQFLNAKNVKTIIDGRNAVLAFERKEGIATLSKGLNENASTFKTLLVNHAVDLNDKKEFKEASLLLQSVYDLDQKDPEKLYYAANFALNAKDYDLALKQYQELKKINFTGESTQYFAVNKDTKKEEQFNSKSERDLYVKATSHEKPRDEKTPSKKPEIVKNIALILVQAGKKQEAIAAIQDARAETPEDTALMMTEANLYYELKDIPNFERIIKEAIQKNPNDAELYFNLGVTSSTAKNTAEAEKYFKKAIELKPDYVDAYVNMAELKLRDEDKFSTEASKLGTSVADTKKYDALVVARKKNLNDVLPFLEKAYDLDSKNEAVAKTLLSVYKNLEMNDKAKALKAKM